MSDSIDKVLSEKDLQDYAAYFNTVPHSKILQNAVARSDLSKVAMNWEQFSLIDHTFSHVVPGEFKKVANQKISGRCWLFAGLNLLRIHMAKKYHLEEFEFSQSYLFFYDKLEKANFFLESMLQTAKEPVDSRIVMHLVHDPVCDGGQWDMFVNLINKYGLVPQSVMPDSHSAENSRQMNYILTLKLREYGCELRKLAEQQTAREALLERKKAMMQEIYHILSLHLGSPPQEFTWEFRDSKKAFHRHAQLTPHTFNEKIVKFDFDDMLCLIHSPRSEITPYYELFTVDYLGNVIEGHPVRYINIPMDVLKEATVKSLTDGQPAWFGCDVGKRFDRHLGVMNTQLYDYEELYNTHFPLTKEERLYYGESQMTHAMLLTGVNVVDGASTKWRVENSWGEKCGQKGYMIMTDTWFDEYLFEVALHKKYIPKEVQKVLTTKTPIHLPPWDPMGALA